MPVPAIARDLEDGKRLGIRGTSTLVINDPKITGAVPSGTLDSLVQRADDGVSSRPAFCDPISGTACRALSASRCETSL